MPRAKVVQRFRRPTPFRRPTQQPVARKPTPKPEPEVHEEPSEIYDESYRPSQPSVDRKGFIRLRDYSEKVRKSKEFYSSLGFEQFTGLYEPFETPEGYKVVDIKETPTGLSVTFQQKQVLIPDEAAAYTQHPETYKKPTEKKTTTKAKLPTLDPYAQIRESIVKSPIGEAVTGVIEGIKKKALDPRTDPSSWEVQIFKPIFEGTEGIEEFKAKEAARYERDPLGYVGEKALTTLGVVAFAINPPAAVLSAGIGVGIQQAITGVTEQRLLTAEEATSTGIQSAGFSLVAGQILKGAAALPKIGEYAGTRLGKTAIMTGIGGGTGYVYSGGDVVEAAKSATLAGGITFGLETVFPTKPDTMLKIRQQKWAMRASKDYPEIDLSAFFPELKGIAPDKVTPKKSPLKTIPSLQETQALQDDLLGLRQQRWVVRAAKHQISLPSAAPLVVDVSDDLLDLRHQKWAIRTMKYQLSLESVLKSEIPELPKSLEKYIQPIKKTGYRGGTVVQSGKQALIQIQKEIQQQKVVVDVAKEVARTKSVIVALTLRQKAAQKMMEEQKQREDLLGVGAITAQITKAAQRLKPKQAQKQRQAPAQAAAQAQKLGQPQAQKQVQPTTQALKMVVPTLQLQITTQIEKRPPQKTKHKRKREETLEELWAKQSLRYMPLREFTAFSGLKKSLKTRGVVANYILGFSKKTGKKR